MRSHRDAVRDEMQVWQRTPTRWLHRDEIELFVVAFDPVERRSREGVVAFVVGKIAAASGTPFYPKVGLEAILLATLFSTAVGLFFGIYPANRAANLEPVEALRYE